jgi:hypothetical protein
MITIVPYDGSLRILFSLHPPSASEKSRQSFRIIKIVQTREILTVFYILTGIGIIVGFVDAVAKASV